MNPDQEFEAYYKDNPQGNHSGPSSLTFKFMDEQKQVNEKLLDVISDVKVDIAVVKEQVNNLHEYFKSHTKDEENHVTQNEFWPIKTVTYGMVGIILIGTLIALLTLVVPHFRIS